MAKTSAERHEAFRARVNATAMNALEARLAEATARLAELDGAADELARVRPELDRALARIGQQEDAIDQLTAELEEERSGRAPKCRACQRDLKCPACFHGYGSESP